MGLFAVFFFARALLNSEMRFLFFFFWLWGGGRGSAIYVFFWGGIYVNLDDWISWGELRKKKKKVFHVIARLLYISNADNPPPPLPRRWRTMVYIFFSFYFTSWFSNPKPLSSRMAP